MYLIICPEWRFRGFTEIMNRVWFEDKATVVGLHYLKNNLSVVSNSIKDDTLDIVFIDSMYEPLYKCIDTLIKNPSVKHHSIVKLIVENFPEHYV